MSQKRSLTNYDKLLAYNVDNSFNISDKTQMWIPDQEKGYVLGEVLSGKGTGKIKFKLGSGEMLEVEESKCEEANPGKFDGVADMSDLSHLNEASVFHNLRKRYEQDLIHTYSGLFLVVINPYKWLQIYTEEIIHMYQGKRRKEVHPHVYALADEAYRNMLNDRKNQSMLITGESGAGKTENTKKVIQYIANIAGRSGGVGKLEQQILQANPMLEAFGNAKTNKNDNSSRFGKFIRLQFNQGGVIVGTTIQTYLLEKSRVVGQGKGERNFHIFYQILTDPEVKNKLQLTQGKNYSFITGGDCLEVRSIDDKKEFEHTKEAMNIIGIDAEEQEAIFRIMAAIMHLGNVEFEAQFGGEGCEVKNAEKALNIASELLRVNSEKLRDAIVKPFITAGNERIQKHFSVEQAQYSLKAMCKAVYERVFLWLIQKLNKILAADSEAYFIGVLDIAGFEIFEINSFEQLCINFTNEKLQQFFNQHMFTLEQEEYEREKIEWKFIDFQMDGQDTIDLIEKKPNSILSFLDEESIFPRATNKTLITKLHTLAGKNKKYGKVQFKDLNFKIQHYAGAVDYNVDGWIEKNKDPLQDDIEKCIKASEDYFIANLFQDPGLDPRASVMEKKKQSGQRMSRGSSTGSKGGASFMTVATAYKEQLDDLMDTLRSTYPHFIRCIIPNLKKQPGLLVAPLVLEQLACNGVLEGIRISRKGYPNRLLYNEFVKRYYLLDGAVKRDDPETKEATKTIMKNLDSRIKKDVVSEEVGHLYQFGITKIFFRHGVLAKLEEYREQKLGQMVVAIQSGCRAWLARSAFKKLGKQTHAAQTIRKNVASWLEIRDWKWWVIFQKIKPLIPQMKVDEEMDKMKEEIKTLKENLESKTNEANKLNEQLNKAKGDLESSRNELDQANEKLSKLVDERNKLDKENEDLNDDIDKLEEQIRELNRVKLQNEGEIKNLDEQFQTLQQQLENTKKTNEQKILDLDRQLEEARGNVSKLEKKVQSLEKELRQANDALEEAEGEKDKLNKENKLLQSYLENAKQEQSDLENTNRNLQKDLNETKQRLEEESDLKQKAEFQSKSFQQKYNDLKTEFEQLEQDFEELDSKLKKGGILSTEQKNQMIEMEQNLQKFTEKNKSLEKQLANVNHDLSEKEKAFQNLERNYKKLQFEYQTLQDQLNQAEERANKSESQRKKAENNLKNVTQEKETALNDLDYVRRTLKSAQEEISNLREDLEQEQNEKQINEKQRKNLLNDVEELKKELETESQLRDTAEGEKKRLQLENEDLKDKIEELTLSGGSGLNEKQTEEINELKKALEKEREGRNKSDSSRREYKDKIAKLEQIIEELERKLNASEKSNKRLEEEFTTFSNLSDRFNKEVKEFLEKSKRERNKPLFN